MERRINIKRNYVRPRRAWQSLILAGILLFGLSLPAAASYLPFNTNVNMKVGIGTSTPQGALTVMSGNVGIGTWVPSTNLNVIGDIQIGTPIGAPGTLDIHQTTDNSANGLRVVNTTNATSLRVWADVFGGHLSAGANDTLPILMNSNGSGFVGIGSAAPGQLLDVQGTIRTTGFTLNLNPSSGYVIVGNGVGVGTWMAASTLPTSGGSGTNYWLNDTGNVGISTIYAVGIGTISQINTLNILGNVGIGTFSYDPYLKNKAPNGGMVISGNVGIGTWLPAASLDVETAASSGFAVYGNSSNAGGTGVAGNDTSSGTGVFGTSNTGIAVLAQSSSATLYGLEAQNFGGGPSAFFQSGTNAAGTQSTLIVEQFSTSTADLFQAQNASGISMANITSVGNVGIGTFAPNGKLVVSGGNVGIGSLAPGQILDVQGTIRTTGLTLNLNPSAGYVLVGNGVGVGTWMAASTLATSGGSSQWTTTNVNDVYLPNNGNVGIGTSFTNSGAALSIMNGNVGIGTWSPIALFQVGSGPFANVFSVNSSGKADSKEFELIAGVSDTGHVGTDQNANQGFYPWDPNDNLTLNSEHSIYLNGGALGNTTYIAMTNAGNLGIGTIIPVASLGIVGNIGIGTNGNGDKFLTNSPPNGGMIIEGNVGIGSLVPGQALDVNGTVRMTGLTLNQNPGSGYVLVGNGVGVGTWMPAGTLAPANGSNYWLNTAAAGNVGISTTNTVGIGTTSGVGAGLVIMNGNVGIGTWKPSAALDVETGGNTYFGGNVGIGSSAPGETLDIQGVLRTTNFNLSTNPTSGFVLTTDAFGNGTWQSLSGNSGWTVSGNNVYETDSGNVGIGTTTVNQGALVVTNGNVGIGTWAPLVPLQVVGVGTQAPNGGGLIVTNGNVGIGTTLPGSPLFVNGGTITSYNPIEATGEGLLAYVGNGKAIAMQAGTANGNILYDNSGGFSFQAEARGSVLQGTSSSSNITMFIDNNGNVGIGTSQSVLGGLIVQNGNVGIGTNRPQAAMVVMGNQGIGTWSAGGGNLIVNGGGNVGIGSAWPGTMLDVQGTLRGIGEIINGNIGIGTSALQTAFAVAYGNVGIGTWTASSGLQLKESFAFYRLGTGASVQSSGQTIIGVTSTASARTITLATADVVLGRVIIIKDESGGAAVNNITVNTQGGQTIDGVSTVTISANYGVLRVYSDGNNWFTF
jgi:hypothetical protein